MKIIGNDVHIKRVGGDKKSAPPHVLKRLRQYIDAHPVSGDDQAWLVVDRNNWKKQDIDELAKWVAGDPGRRGLALSNPCFELWLLLHYEDAPVGASCRDYERKLRDHIADYGKSNKNIGNVPITRGMVEDAIRRARKMDTCGSANWPDGAGVSWMYKLAEQILG